jgi:hypothetical protein
MQFLRRVRGGHARSSAAPSAVGVGLLGTAVAFWPLDASAYIDPGLASTLIQAFFAMFFGTAAALVLRPWQRFRAWMSGKPVEPAAAPDDAAEAAGRGDADD